MMSITLKLTAILPATRETRPLRGLPHVPLEVAQQAGVALFLLCLQPLRGKETGMGETMGLVHRGTIP